REAGERLRIAGGFPAGGTVQPAHALPSLGPVRLRSDCAQYIWRGFPGQKTWPQKPARGSSWDYPNIGGLPGPWGGTQPGKRATADANRPGVWRDGVLLALTFAAGCVDALSYLGLSHVFTANMTGNAVLLGLAIGQTQELQVAHSSAAIVGFVGGVVMAAKLVGPPRDRVVWSSRITFALGLEFVV